MDQRIEKAFETANYMATLSNQRRILLEEFSQKLVYYVNGGTFKITPELIAFTTTLVDKGHTDDTPIIDSNNYPIIIANVEDFCTNITSIYFESLNDFTLKYNDLKSKRKVRGLVDL